MLARQGRRDEALELLERAVASDPSFAIAHYSVACMYALHGRRTEMLVAVEKAIALEASRRDEIRADADFTAYRDDPDFRRALGEA